MASWGGCPHSRELAGKQVASRTAGAALIISCPGRRSGSSQQHELSSLLQTAGHCQSSLPTSARQQEIKLSRLCPMSKAEQGKIRKQAAQKLRTRAFAPALQVKSIIGTLEEALPTPSHAVQDAVSGCLAPLMTGLAHDKSFIEDLLQRLLCTLVTHPQFAQRSVKGTTDGQVVIGALQLPSHQNMQSLTCSSSPGSWASQVVGRLLQEV